MAEKIDIILAGVGGQGVLSVGAVVSMAAIRDGLTVRQSEVHGMAQRGGAVLAHLRISSGSIESDLIPRGGADVILSMEPLESLRYLEYLKPDGHLITAVEPVKNIPDYPALDEVLEAVKAQTNAHPVDAGRLAKEAGTEKAVNMVLTGALSARLPIRSESVTEAVREKFAAKGDAVVKMNLEAFHLGYLSGAAG